MATSARKLHYTVEDVLAMPWDGRLREVINGKLFVTNAPVLRHERAVRLLATVLHPYAMSIGAELFGAPADIVLTPETLVQPDLFVVPREEGVALLEWSQIKTLLLTVEVISPSTAKRDRTDKRHYYQQRKIQDYWIVDNTKRQVERWRPDQSAAEVLKETLIWHPDPAHPPLTIDLLTFFRKVHDE